MNVASGSEGPRTHQDVDTLDAGLKKPARQEPLISQPRDEEAKEEEVFEDASVAGKVFMRRAAPRPPVQRADYFPPPVHPMVSTSPSIKPERFDDTSDWSEYKTFLDQLAELYRWDEERKALMLGICLRREARIVRLVWMKHKEGVIKPSLLHGHIVLL